MCIRDRVNSHPAVYGYHLKDEPGGDQFAELAKSAALVRELAPGKWPYINLPPGMGDWYENDYINCLLYTSDAADDLLCVDLGGRRIIKKKKTNT